MDEARRLALQYVLHKSLTTQEFALALIKIVAVKSGDEAAMLAIAEPLALITPVGGDGW